MTCAFCLAAETTPMKDAFDADCLSCNCRALATLRPSIAAVSRRFGDKAEEAGPLIRKWMDVIERRKGKR